MINCFDCKLWHDEDLVVHYPDEGLYRCRTCAYKHEKKVNAALTTRLQEAEDVIKSGQAFVLKMWEVYDEPQYRMAFNLLQEHHGKYDGKTWSKEQGEFTARAAAWLKGGTE